MGSLGLAGMGSSQRKQKQGVRTALFSERELDWLPFLPVMAPKGLSFCWHSEQAAAFAGGFCREVTLVAPGKGLSPAHTGNA